MSSLTQHSGASELPVPIAEAPIYGWRFVPTTRADGTEGLVEVPLTLEDVLHPQYGDVMPQSTLHDVVCDYLANVFRAATYHDPTALVVSDVIIYWEDPALKNHSPDVGAIFGVRDRDKNRSCFYCATENARPSVLVEIVSPHTRDNDVEIKVIEYHKARVPLYVILDRKRADDPWQLRGYQYAPGRYLDMPKDERGRLWLASIGVWLSVDEQKVICHDGVTDEVIGDFTETRRQLLEMRDEAEAEKSRADEEKARADEEKARAEEEKARADEEKARAEAAAARVKQLEAELARLRSQPPSP